MVAAGAQVAADVPLEISPLAALDAEDLAQRLRSPFRVEKPLVLGEASDELAPRHDR
jgi:hypothetical protein